MRLSPLNQRRLRNFRGNWRGWWSLWLFLLLFAISLFSEVIASDRPIVVSYKGEWLFPIVVNYPESKFGGFLAVTDYKDPVILDEIKTKRELTDELRARLVKAMDQFAEVFAAEHAGEKAAAA